MGGGSKQPSTTTQIQKTELPKWVEGASQENYEFAKDVSERPLVQYEGDRVAGLSALEAAAPGTLATGQNAAMAGHRTAMDAARAGAGFQPGTVTGPGGVDDVTAQSFLARNIGAYMDPEIEAQINPTMNAMRRNIRMGVQGIADTARGAGAWGGSRHGVAEGVYGAEGARAMAQTEADLRGRAFESAAGRAGADIQSALQAALANQGKGVQMAGLGQAAKIANQQAGIAGAGVRLNAGQLASSAGSAAAEAAARNAVLQSQFGATERGIEQAQHDIDYGTFLEARDYPEEQLNMRLAALGMSPYGKTTSGTTTAPNTNTSNPWLTGVGAAASILPMMFGMSDRKTKKNIKKIGKVEGTDLNKYEFDYKPGFMGRTGPVLGETPSGKKIGLMADDVKRKVPGAVVPAKIGGKKVDVVDYPLALAGAKKRDGRSDKGRIRGTYRPRVGVGGRVAGGF